MEIIIAYLVLGLFAGTLSGLVGIGGGVIIVPALIFLFKFSQHSAQGTTLALMVPPVGILAALMYYRYGFVDIKAAAIICLGFVVGGLIGARLATNLPGAILEKIFGAGLLLISLKMLFGK
jgi:uncharacterized membrane protein YfcA